MLTEGIISLYDAEIAEDFSEISFYFRSVLFQNCMESARNFAFGLLRMRWMESICPAFEQRGKCRDRKIHIVKGLCNENQPCIS